MRTTNDPRAICPICTRPLNNPFRRIVAGKIVEGCVSDAHTGHLIPTTNSAAWHDRPAARALRAATRADDRANGIRVFKPGTVAL